MEKDKVKTLCIGTTLQNGKYTIVKELGHGSFGITYQATTDVALNGKLGNMNVKVNVAIKEFFMPDLNNRAVDGSTVEGTKNTLVVDYRRKFRREAENLARLHHAGIVKVLEIFDENNTTYYVMEYIEGENLDKYIMRRGHLDENETKVVVCEIASALEYMHKYRMLHLDLKPKNIMHDSNGRVKLIDFGLSKQYTAEGEPESSTSIGMGTPGYAPIEQANYHQDGTFPVTLDIYAFGATIYKMLTGQTPPHASDLLEDGFPEMMFRNLGVSEHMIGCVKKAMGPTKKSRYQTVDGMVRDIERDDVSSGEIPTVNDGTEDDEMTYIHEDRQHNAVEDEQININEIKDGHNSDDETMSRNKKVFLVFLFLVVCGVVIWLMSGNNKQENTKPDDIVDSSLAIPQDELMDDTIVPTGTPDVKSNADDNGKMLKDKKVITQPEPPKAEENRVFEVVEQMPAFPGGDVALMRYLQENTRYPTIAAENGVQGRVVVGFVVEKDGSITDVRVIKSQDPALDHEAVRVVKSMPRWTPGKIDGAAVRVEYQVPVVFRLH